MNLKNLPKIDLHHHFDGAFRPESLYAEAKRRNLPESNLSLHEFRTKVQVGKDCRSLTDFLKTFFFFYHIPASSDFLEKAAWETVEDFRKDNVIYAETRFAPHLFQNPNLSLEQIIKAVIAGLKKGSKQFGIHVNLILCVMRGAELKYVEELIEYYEHFKNQGIVGLDLAGDESRFPSLNFEQLFKKAHSKNIPVTIHAGEAAGPNSVWDALLKFQAKRIGHGVRSIEDPKLMEYLIEHKIPLEICLTSNLQTGVFNEYFEHPFLKIFQSGIVTTLNTDDPSISNINLTHEWEIAVKEFGLEKNEIKKILMNSIDASFATNELKLLLRKEIDSYF